MEKQLQTATALKQEAMRVSITDDAGGKGIFEKLRNNSLVPRDNKQYMNSSMSESHTAQLAVSRENSPPQNSGSKRSNSHKGKKVLPCSSFFTNDENFE